jgi:hypothetical protein
MQTHDRFPPRLELVAQPKLCEVFGIEAALGGALAVCVCVGLSLPCNDGMRDDLQLKIVLVFVMGLGLIAFEILRRWNRAVLVVPKGRGSLAVYRRGALERVIPRAQLKEDHAYAKNMRWTALNLGLRTLLPGVAIAATSAPYERPIVLYVFVPLIVLGCALVASAVRRGVSCARFTLPSNRGDSDASIVLPYEDAIGLRMSLDAR